MPQMLDPPRPTPQGADDDFDTLADEVAAFSSEPSPAQPLPPLSAAKRIPQATAAPIKLWRRFEGFLVPALVMFLLGNALAFALPGLAFAQWPIGVPLIVALLGIVVYGADKPDARRVIQVDLWAVALVAGSLFYQARHFVPDPMDVSQLAPLARAEVMATVADQSGAHRLVLNVLQVNGHPQHGRLLAYLPKDLQIASDEPIVAGTRVLMDGELSLPFDTAIPGAFSQRDYLMGQQITAVLRKPSRLIAFERSKQPQAVLQRVTDQLKQRVSDTFARSLPSPQAEVLGGVVLGDKAIPVDKDTKQAFIQTGLIHVLAASGLNVGIIAGAVLWLLGKLKVSYRKRLLVAMGAVAFYSLLTGLPPSIQRAATMLELAMALKLLNRELSPVFLLCLATTLLVLLNPDNVGSVGFQFSVLTTFGLVTMVPPLQEKVGYFITRGLAGALLTPLVAQLWIWPLSVAYFNQFPVHSVPLNVAAMLLVAPLTLIGFISGVISLVFPPLAIALTWLAKPFLWALLGLVQWGNNAGWAQWRLPSPAPWMLALLYGSLFLALALIDRLKTWPLQRKTLLILLPLALLLGGAGLARVSAQGHTTIDLLPLSYRHEAVLIQPAGTEAPLLLTPARIAYFEARALADYLKHHQFTRLAVVLALPDPHTQPDATATADPGSLSVALKNIRVARLYFDAAEAVPLHAEPEARAFPAQGASLQWGGGFSVEGSLEALRLLDGQRCLVSVDDQPTHAPAECGVQLVTGGNGVRLFSSVPLNPARFYHLAQTGGALKIY